MADIPQVPPIPDALATRLRFAGDHSEASLFSCLNTFLYWYYPADRDL